VLTLRGQRLLAGFRAGKIEITRRELHMKPAVRAVALVAMAGALCTSNGVLAEESAKTPAPKASNAMPNALRVVVDPETGAIRAPTTEELAAQIARESTPAASSARSAARAAPAASSAVLPTEKSVQRHANGMLSVRMSQESLSALTATTDASGKTKVKHASETAQPVVTAEQ
jgi:hypothetical protein